MNHQATWGASIGGLVIYDVIRAQKGDESTLSCVVRGMLTTKERQAAFLAGWVGLTAWFIPHILGPLYKANIQGPMPLHGIPDSH